MTAPTPLGPRITALVADGLSRPDIARRLRIGLTTLNRRLRTMGLHTTGNAGAAYSAKLSRGYHRAVQKGTVMPAGELQRWRSRLRVAATGWLDAEDWYEGRLLGLYWRQGPMTRLAALRSLGVALHGRVSHAFARLCRRGMLVCVGKENARYRRRVFALAEGLRPARAGEDERRGCGQGERRAAAEMS